MASSGLEASAWRSELASADRLIVHKRVAEEHSETGEYLPIDDDALGLLGTHVVEYEGFVVAAVDGSQARQIAEGLHARGYIARIDSARGIAAPAVTFEPGDSVGRRGPWASSLVPSVPIPGMSWIQFGFPIKGVWVDEIRLCGVQVVTMVPERTLLVYGLGTPDLRACAAVSPFLAAIEPVLSTDRGEPDLLGHEGEYDVSLVPWATEGDLQEFPGLSAVEALADLPGHYRLVGADIGRELLESPLVVSVARVSGEPAGPADERQGLILAREWSTTPGQGTPAQPTATTGFYAHWLAGRGLDGEGNQQVIAVVDTGMDTGDPAGFHVDLAGQLLESYDITQTGLHTGWTPVSRSEDSFTHGTVVAGIAIGKGTRPSPSPPGGLFVMGQGVAPGAGGVSIKRYRQNGNCGYDNTTGAAVQVQLRGSLDAAFVDHGVRIANNSWNETSLGYDQWARLLDRIVLNTRSSLSGEPRRQVNAVISAGNTGAQLPGTTANKVIAPATGKNVIAVGSVDTSHPGGTVCAGIPTSPDPIGNAFTMSEFSSRGEVFGIGEAMAAHTARVKPDIVAPGWRVEGPRRGSGGCTDGPCGTGSNVPGTPVYAYAGGTSFSAPAASGAVALKRKELLDGQTNIWPAAKRDANSFDPAPSLLKAALVATARSLGPVEDGVVSDCWNDDCRPSHHSGWGLLDLDRLTDRTVPFYVVNEHQAPAVTFDSAGDSWTSPVLIPGDLTQDVVIAVVWNDIIGSSLQSALFRDLDIVLQDYQGTGYFVGNNFHENAAPFVPADDGYSQGFGFLPATLRDGINTVEVIAIPPGGFTASSKWQLTVSSWAHTPDPVNLPTQSFSVYAWNVRCWKSGFLCF